MIIKLVPIVITEASNVVSTVALGGHCLKKICVLVSELDPMDCTPFVSSIDFGSGRDVGDVSLKFCENWSQGSSVHVYSQVHQAQPGLYYSSQ